MVDDAEAGWLARIGRLISEKCAASTHTLALFIAQSNGSYEFAIYRVGEATADYLDMDFDTSHAIASLSGATEGALWSVFDYTLEGGGFRARYVYPDDLPPEEDPFEAMTRIVAERFGNREIRYPPLPPSGKGASFTL